MFKILNMNTNMILLSKIGIYVKLNLMNTLKSGKFRHIVFKDSDTWYAVALEFNIVAEGDDAQLAYSNLIQSVLGYLESCRKIKGARMHPLNQKSDSEYEDLWTNLNSKKPLKSPFKIAMYGYSAV